MPCPKDPSRTDTQGRAHAGSQRQIQTYVNERESELSCAVADALSAYKLNPAAIRWVSPLRAEGYAEFQDAEFLKAVGAENLAPRLSEFWPHRGPCWDALARMEGGGCVLVEAKSHVSEIFGNGCGAGDGSRTMIQSSLAKTKKWLGANPEADWLGRLYQSANRLAHLYFLREIGNTNAYLVNLYFCGDTHFPNAPRTREEWDREIKLVNEELGISVSAPCSASVFLEAGS
jgi:hypothetical protein